MSDVDFVKNADAIIAGLEEGLKSKNALFELSIRSATLDANFRTGKERMRQAILGKIEQMERGALGAEKALLLEVYAVVLNLEVIP